MTEKEKIRQKAKEIHDDIWGDKDKKYLKFAEEQAKQWTQESNAPSPIRRDIIEDQILTDILNDNTYDYKSYVNDSYGSPEYMTTKNGGHFTDKYKTIWHPTFSNESQYSNNISDYNPNGIEGGYWEDNTYRLSKDQEDNNWNIQRTKDYLDESETEPIKLLSNSGMPIYISNPKGEGGYYYNPFKDGSDIYIKPSHRGRLTALKQRTGKSEAELYRTGGPEVRKMITFARNARKWKHDEGGNMFPLGGESWSIENQDRNKVYNNYENAVDNNMGPFITNLRKGLRYAKDYISDSVPAGISNCTLTATQWVDPNNPIMSAKTIVSNPDSVGYFKINADQAVPGDLLIAKVPGKDSYHTMYISGFDNEGKPLLDYSRGGMDVEKNLRTNIPIDWYTANSDGHTQNLYFRNNKFAKSILPEVTVIGKNKKKEDGGNIYDGNKSSQIPLIADRDFYVDSEGRFYYDNDKGTLLPSKETVMYYNPSYKEGDSIDWLKNYYVDRDSLTRVPKGSKYYQQSDGAIRFEPTIEINDTKGIKTSANDKPLELVSPEFTALTTGKALANGTIDAMIEPVYNWTLRNPTTTKLIGAGIEAPMYSELIQRRLIDRDNSGGFTQNLIDSTIGLGALSRMPTIANNAYNLTKQGLNWTNRNYIQPYKLSRAIYQSKFVPDYYDALYNENVLRNSVDNNFNYLFHSRRKDIGNYLPIITKSKSKELGFYGKDDIKNKIWWKHGYPFYEETNAIPTVAVPVKGKSNFIVQKVNNHFDPNIYVSDEVSLSDDAIRLTNVPFQNRWVPQNHFIYNSKLSKPKVTIEPEVSTIDFNTARTAQEQPTNLLLDNSNGLVNSSLRNIDDALFKQTSDNIARGHMRKRNDFLRLSEESSVEDAQNALNEAQQNSKYNFFDRLLNTDRYKLAQKNADKLDELQQNLNIANTRLTIKPNDGRVNYVDQRLSNISNYELLNKGIDANKQYDIYESLQDFINQSKTLKGNEDKLKEFQDAVREYDRLRESNQSTDKALENINNIADELNKIGASDDELNRFANFIYNNYDRNVNLFDASAIPNKDFPFIIAPQKADTRWIWVVNHERNHLMQNAKKAFQNFKQKFGKDTGFDFSNLSESSKEYLEELTEQLARGTQIKDFFGIKDGQPITAAMLKYAKKYYQAQTGMYNNMKEFFDSITNYDKAAQWLSYAMGYGIPATITTGIGLSAASNQQDLGETLLNKYQEQ